GTNKFRDFYFFFQAEDGIRDGHVTGVQTCALPIFGSSRSMTFSPVTSTGPLTIGVTCSAGQFPLFVICMSTRVQWFAWSPAFDRSEERRVGKESRSRPGPATKQKKDIQAQISH